MQHWKKAASLLFWMFLGAVTYRFLSSNKANRDGIPCIVHGVKLSSMAWTLSVTIAFSEKSDLDRILKDWTALAMYCAENEDFLYHYEVGIDDSNPLIVHIMERYRSQDEYLNVHKKSITFLNFRSQLQALQDSKKVVISGFSFQESGNGFTGK